MGTLLSQLLADLRTKVTLMAGQVEKSLLLATKALAKKDAEAIKEVFLSEEKINQFHKDIDRSCFKLLARQSPVASDLRQILAITKINVDLERMGDLACNISYGVKDYLDDNPVLTAADIPKMADLVRSMVKKSLDAFMHNDEDLAREVLIMDDVVDKYRDEFLSKLKNEIRSVPVNTDSCLELINMVRNLERIGDHSTNIVEEVIFSLTGEDIRHLPNETNRGGDKWI